MCLERRWRSCSRSRGTTWRRRRGICDCQGLEKWRWIKVEKHRPAVNREPVEVYEVQEKLSTLDFLEIESAHQSCWRSRSIGVTTTKQEQSQCPRACQRRDCTPVHRGFDCCTREVYVFRRCSFLLPARKSYTTRPWSCRLQRGRCRRGWLKFRTWL